MEDLNMKETCNISVQVSDEYFDDISPVQQKPPRPSRIDREKICDKRKPNTPILPRIEIKPKQQRRFSITGRSFTPDMNVKSGQNSPGQSYITRSNRNSCVNMSDISGSSTVRKTFQIQKKSVQMPRRYLTPELGSYEECKVFVIRKQESRPVTGRVHRGISRLKRHITPRAFPGNYYLKL